VLDKLPGIKADLVRGKPDWQSWGFSQLSTALKEWTEIQTETLATTSKSADKLPRQQRSFFQAQEHTPSCVYCDQSTHKSVDCTKLKTSDERKKSLSEQKRCFNCTGTKHQAAKCRSRGNCAKCQGRHHTSICDKSQERSPPGVAMTAVSERVCHPVVIVKVNGVKCRALLDTGSTSTYMSAFLVDLLKIKPKQTLTRSIKTIVGLVTKRVETYSVEISDNDGKCVLPVSATKVDRKELLSLDNPNYPELLRRYPYLKGINMEETSVKPELPIHVILGANEYTKIKMAGYQRAGKMGEPVAEQTLGTTRNCVAWTCLVWRTRPLETRTWCMQSLLNNFSAAQKAGMRLGFPGRGDTLPCQTTREGV